MAKSFLCMRGCFSYGEKFGEGGGEVSHYFTKIGVAVVELTGKIKVGDSISVKGMTTNFEQKVESMQVEGENIEEANPGDDIGMKVADRVRKGDIVYRLGE